MRKLVVHAGAGKTGTSALQAFFEDHRDWLGTQGVVYPPGPFPVDPVTRISSGNGQWLLRYLTDGTGWDSFAAQLAGAGRDADVLISSELLAHAPTPEVAALRDRLAARGLELHVVYVVRNVDEWFLSAYQQLVKRHGLTKTYAEFCDWYPCEFGRTIEHYLEAIGPKAFRVLSYEAGKPDLVGYFLRQALGTEAAPPPAADAPVNRSLTSLEVEVLVAVNTLVAGAGMAAEEAGALVGRFADTLVSAFPSIGEHSRFAEPMPASAVDRLRSEVALVNSRLDEGQVGFSVQHRSPALNESERGLVRVVAAQVFLQVQSLLEQQQASREQMAYLDVLIARMSSDSAELEAMRNSRSWRATAPIRRISAR